MRQGELLALRWPNVDLDDATVQVVASSVHLGKQARTLVGRRMVITNGSASRSRDARAGRSSCLAQQSRHCADTASR